MLFINIGNMVRASVPKRVPIMVSGHKTIAMLKGHNIVNEEELIMAAKKQEKYLQAKLGIISGSVKRIPTKKGSAKIG